MHTRTPFRPALSILLLPLLAVLSWLLLLTLIPFARAQDLGLPGVPGGAAGLLIPVIGILSGFLVLPLTAIAKRLGRTSGPSTVAVSAVMSLLVSIGFVLWQAAVARGSASLVEVLVTALIAFVQSNGAYLAHVAAAAKGANPYPVTLPPVIGDHILYPANTPGTEPLMHNGVQIGSVLPLTPRAPEVATPTSPKV